MKKKVIGSGCINLIYYICIVSLPASFPYVWHLLLDFKTTVIEKCVLLLQQYCLPIAGLFHEFTFVCKVFFRQHK